MGGDSSAKDEDACLPECMQDLLREHITALAQQVELAVADARPTPERWEKRSR